MKVSQKIYHKFTEITDPYLIKLRKSRINNDDFTIISNNCWGGAVYRRYGLPYNSPTVGLFFFAEDYVKFCGNLQHYMKQELQFISRNESRHKMQLISTRYDSVPIGRLDDIEIVFLHYKSQDEAKEKWNRRRERVNYNNLIFKFSKMNECTDTEISMFDRLQARKKFVFLPYKGGAECGIYFPTGKPMENIENDTAEYSRYIDVDRLINASYVNGYDMR